MRKREPILITGFSDLLCIKTRKIWNDYRRLGGYLMPKVFRDFGGTSIFSLDLIKCKRRFT